MEEIDGVPHGQKLSRLDWINPLRLYDPRVPAGRLVFLWGLVIFPVIVIFVLLTIIITAVETAYPNIDPDYIGLIVWPFMLAWVAAMVAITRRRLRDLHKSQGWISLAILPIVDIPLFLYLLVKPGPAGRHRDN